MTETTRPNLGGVAETLLVTLYIRALESQRPDALLKDEKAVALVKNMNYDFSQFAKILMDEDDKLTIILRNREFDRQAQGFLARNPKAVVVHIGCGLDSRFERVDNGQVEWYDLDLPEVIDLRRQLIGDEGPRYHLLPNSAFDEAWLPKLDIHSDRPFLFLAEGVFMYFPEALVRTLVLALRDRFPGAELVCDAFSPFLVRANNLKFKLSGTKIGLHYYWGLSNGKDVEKWGDDISLLDDWFIFDHPEPRLDHIKWMRHIPLMARVIGIFHYRLGKTIEAG
jgi:O-methyltransferase involved in polyketide biosynthesis